MFFNSYKKNNFSIFYKNSFTSNINLKSVKIKNNFFNKIFLLSEKNYNNKFNLRCFILFVNNIFKYDKKILLIDSDMTKFLPFYTYIFGFLDVQTNKNFFFFNKKKIIYSNFLYYYNNFIKIFKISFILFFDYINYINYFKYFLKFGLPISSIIFNKNQSAYLDYYFIISKNNYNICKFYVYNMITSNFFLYYKLKNFNKKIIFFNNLNKLSGF